MHLGPNCEFSSSSKAGIDGKRRMTHSLTNQAPFIQSDSGRKVNVFGEYSTGYCEKESSYKRVSRSE
jgi:hypothetical protein